MDPGRKSGNWPEVTPWATRNRMLALDHRAATFAAMQCGARPTGLERFQVRWNHESAVFF
jgi:hypothetical protein